jgi:hypothetical protein
VSDATARLRPECGRGRPVLATFALLPGEDRNFGDVVSGLAFLIVSGLRMMPFPDVRELGQPGDSSMQNYPFEPTTSPFVTRIVGWPSVTGAA